jgi:predicted membrane protein
VIETHVKCIHDLCLVKLVFELDLVQQIAAMLLFFKSLLSLLFILLLGLLTIIMIDPP